jgi:sulfoxide reductase heme-binding subunit YedZ
VVSAVDRRYRYLYKPLLFAACLVPLLWAVGGVLAGSGLLPQWTWLGLGADPVRKVLGIFGKTILNLLMLTLAVTPLRQISGNANLIRLRRMLGVFAFFYACLHFLTYVGPYQSLSWDAIVKDIYKRPYITVGFSALLMLIPLAVTSTNAMMRRLKRRWQKLHRLVYVIAIFGVWHYWWQVKQDISEPQIYAVILAVLLGWRLWKYWQRRQASTSTSVPPTAPERT